MIVATRDMNFLHCYFVNIKIDASSIITQNGCHVHFVFSGHVHLISGQRDKISVVWPIDIFLRHFVRIDCRPLLYMLQLVILNAIMKNY